MPCRTSAAGAQAFTAQSPNHFERPGNQGTGASTRLVAWPLANRWRSRFSTKMPWFGRAACGNRVEKVSRRTGRIYETPPDTIKDIGTLPRPLALIAATADIAG